MFNITEFDKPEYGPDSPDIRTLRYQVGIPRTRLAGRIDATTETYCLSDRMYSSIYTEVRSRWLT